MFNFFYIIQCPRVIDGTHYNILFCYDMVKKKIVKNSHMFDLKSLIKDQMHNLRFSILNESMKPYPFNVDLKLNPISFVLVIFLS